jgi:hypothetical protein
MKSITSEALKESFVRQICTIDDTFQNSMWMHYSPVMYRTREVSLLYEQSSRMLGASESSSSNESFVESIAATSPYCTRSDTSQIAWALME